MIPMQGWDVLSERTYAGSLHSWEESVQSVCWCFSPCVRVQYGRFQRTIGRLIKLSNHITPSPAITNRCGAEVDCAQARPKPSAAGCHHLWKAGTCCPKEHNVGSVPFLRSCCSKWLSVCFFSGSGKEFVKEGYRGLMQLRTLVLLFNWGQIHLPTFSRAVDLRPLFSPFFAMSDSWNMLKPPHLDDKSV